FAAWFNFSCDESATFEKQIVLKEQDAQANEYRQRSLTDENLTLLSQSGGKLVFSEKLHPICVSDCGCLGADHHSFMGIHTTKKLVLIASILLLFFTVVLLGTQFQMLPNSQMENTII